MLNYNVKLIFDKFNKYFSEEGEMKKFLVAGLVFLMGFLFLSTDGYAREKKNIKFRLSFPVVENYISSSSNPQEWNLSLNKVGSFDEDIAWDFLGRIAEGGEDWWFSLIGFSDTDPGGIGIVIAKSYDYEKGYIFPFYGARECGLKKTGLPLRAGCDIRLSGNWWLGLEYHQSRNLVLGLYENLDFVTIDKLEARRLSGSGDWLDEYTVFHMEFSRTFEERAKTFKFRNINFDILLKHDLLGNSGKISFCPELGINLCILKERLEGSIKKYNYEPSMFPESFWPGEPLENYRELTAEDKLKKTDYKLRSRFFVGASAEYRPFKFIGISCELRLHNKSRKELFQKDSMFDDLLFDLKLNKFTFSARVFLAL